MIFAGPTRGRLRWALLVGMGAVLLASASLASAAITVTPLPAGQPTQGIPQFTLTSDLGQGTTIHWIINGPGGVVGEDTELSPVTIILPWDDQGPHTLSATDVAMGVPALLPGTNFVVDTLGPPSGVVSTGPPVVTGIVSPLAFSWTRPADGTSSHWQLFDSVAGLVAEATTAATEVAVTPTLPAGNRLLRFQVRNLDLVGNPSLFSAPYVFNVDQTPPGPPAISTAPPILTRIRTPSFTWQGTEAGGKFEWDITEGSKSVVSAGTVRSTDAASISNIPLSISPTVIHNLVFRLRQIDPYGNRSAERTYGFTVVPPLVAPPATRSAKLMSPKAGATGTSLMPLLSWRRMHGGTVLFNVKIFQGRREIVSSFPSRNRYRVPKGKLKRGVLYTWRVWSYIGKKRAYAPLPMTSYFTTRK